MRTFVIRARHSAFGFRDATRLGTAAHFEIVLHTVMNAFFISKGFRKAVQVYIVFDSTPDFPKTVCLSSDQGLSFQGFHEAAILQHFEEIFKLGNAVRHNETISVLPGVTVSGFGFEVLVQSLLKTRSVYLLDRKGKNIRETTIPNDPVFLLSDHLSMPKNSVQRFLRLGLSRISLGKTMLFASQCVTLIHSELDACNSV